MAAVDLSIEDAVQDAFETALRRWPEAGVPPSPAGWIITTARHRAIDWLRRESRRDDRQREAAYLQAASEPPIEHPVDDDQLRLMFTCCHPALAGPAQVALTLRLIGGLQTPEIARALLVSETTMAELDGLHLYHAARADLLERLGRPDQAAVAYDRALELAVNEVERRHLERRRRRLHQP